jgi:glutathione synthase/RimK-type ligase-like ATP-grasp enzyme
MTIALLTDARYVNPTDPDWYVQNILDEAGFLTEALEKRGFSVIRKAWSDTAVNWFSVDFAVFRTTWDYFDRFDEFTSWLKETSLKCRFINTMSLVKWNIDKHYLLDLQTIGIRIVPTQIHEVGNVQSLDNWMKELKLTDAVLKPAISGAGRHTYRITTDNINEHESILKELLANEAMMLQPFMKNVITEGEIALMVIGGKYSHAVKKIAKPGDFRVQDDFGGTVEGFEPSKDLIQFAEDAVKACPELPVYARVDVILDNEEKWALAELELIEPEMWFRLNTKAADLLADAIVVHSGINV